MNASRVIIAKRGEKPDIVAIRFIGSVSKAGFINEIATKDTQLFKSFIKRSKNG